MFRVFTQIYTSFALKLQGPGIAHTCTASPWLDQQPPHDCPCVAEVGPTSANYDQEHMDGKTSPLRLGIQGSGAKADRRLLLINPGSAGNRRSRLSQGSHGSNVESDRRFLLIKLSKTMTPSKLSQPKKSKLWCRSRSSSRATQARPQATYLAKEVKALLSSVDR